jgi:hypothetical protein
MLFRELAHGGALFCGVNPLTPIVLWQVIAWEEENN